jgi:hypothetical protein
MCLVVMGELEVEEPVSEALVLVEVVAVVW